MPYILKKVKDGYKVCKKDNPSECYSKKPLTEEKANKQRIAIILSEKQKNDLMGGLKPLTARVGGKVLLKKKLVEEFFPPSNSYNTYVEPFVGGGSVYFFKDKDDHNEVINDIDPDIYTIFKGFQEYDGKKIAEAVNGNYSKRDFEKLRDAEPTTDFDKFIKTFLMYRLSFFGRGKTFGKPRINASFKDYKERLKGVTILNKDYKDVINKYDSNQTFFYLDPPVKESTGNFYFPAINPEELVNTLKKIKGRFLLSWADTKIKKDLFKDFNIFTVRTKYVGEKTVGSQTKQVREYIITNYTPGESQSEQPAVAGAIPPNSTLHKMEKESYSVNPIDILDMYQLVETTPTMKLYKNNNIYIVAIRGTDVNDPEDLYADLMIPLGKLRESTRFKRDLDTLKSWKKKYGNGEWYSVGHSLGGAILDEFLLMNLLDEGISYNPAVSYNNIDKDIKNKRIYKSGDPLYNVMGRFTKNPEVRQSTTPYDGLINRSEHSISQFEGGAMLSDGTTFNGLSSDLTGVPQNIIDSLPKGNMTMDQYNKGRIIFDWKYENDPAFKEKVESEHKKRLEDSAKYNESDAHKKAIEWGKTVDIPSLFPSKTQAMRLPYDINYLSPEKRREYNDYLAKWTEERNKIFEETNPVNVHNKKAKEWNDEMRRRRESGFAPIVDALTKVGDFAVGTVGNVIGVPGIVGEVYKAFAPPGSKYYQEGTLGEKAKNFATKQASKAINKVASNVASNVTRRIRGSGSMDKFHKQLASVGLDHDTYMKAVKVLAKRNGYDPKKVEMSDDGVHKLVYNSPEGLKRFGRVGYGDFIIWTQQEINGKVPKGFADQKRYVFRSSHGKIEDSGKYSPNQLSINLLW